jgi:lauroyl/myristoyl acyltransferase
LNYLAGRIAVDNHSVVTATRKIVEILDQGGTVGITNNANFGRHLSTPFGVGAELWIAVSPFKLALSRGVSVFPVSVIELLPLARYRVTIGPQIVARPELDEMALEYCSYLLPIVREYPEQWMGWRTIGNSLALRGGE